MYPEDNASVTGVSKYEVEKCVYTHKISGNRNKLVMVLKLIYKTCINNKFMNVNKTLRRPMKAFLRNLITLLL